MGVRPDILIATINAGVPCYVDVADPVEYLDEARNMSADARASGTMALVSAGAFPGERCKRFCMGLCRVLEFL
jgi:saccharopine dehydrogenase-like NADP-dependent oxidoreductase